jgi:hypothetical protein
MTKDRHLPAVAVEPVFMTAFALAGEFEAEQPELLRHLSVPEARKPLSH